MAWGWLQSASAQSLASSNTFTVTPGVNLTSGSTMIVVVSVAAAGVTVGTVKDASNNSFVAIATTGNVNGMETSLWAINTPAGDAGTKPVLTVTMAAAAVATNKDVLVVEFSGIVTGSTLAALVDGTPGKSTGSTNTATGSPTYSSTASNELLVACYGDDGGPLTWTLPSGYTNDNNGGTAKGINTDSNSDIELGFKNSTNGSETSSWGLSGTATGWGIITCAFKLAAGGAAFLAPRDVMPNQAVRRSSTW